MQEDRRPVEACTPKISPELEQEALEQFEAMHPKVDSSEDVHKAQLQATSAETCLYMFSPFRNHV